MKCQYDMQIYTTTLTSGTLVLNKIDGAISIHIMSQNSSESFFTGNIPFKGLSPIPVTLINGEIFNFSASSPASALDGITITWVSGSIDIVVGF